MMKFARVASTARREWVPGPARFSIDQSPRIRADQPTVSANNIGSVRCGRVQILLRRRTQNVATPSGTGRPGTAPRFLALSLTASVAPGRVGRAPDD
jgi:hypothetical protein